MRGTHRQLTETGERDERTEGEGGHAYIGHHINGNQYILRGKEGTFNKEWRQWRHQ